MRLKFSLLIISLTFLLLGCINKNQEKKAYEMKQTPICSIKIDSVGYITVSKEGSEYEIRDKDQLKSVLSKLQNAHVEYIKFGSKNHFTIYSIKGEKIIVASFRDNKYKISGVVYQTEQNIFDWW